MCVCGGGGEGGEGDRSVNLFFVADLSMITSLSERLLRYLGENRDLPQRTLWAESCHLIATLLFKEAWRGSGISKPHADRHRLYSCDYRSAVMMKSDAKKGCHSEAPPSIRKRVGDADCFLSAKS